MSASSRSAVAHVLLTTDAVGGVWTYSLDLGRELARAGVRVSLAVIGPPLDTSQRHQAGAAGLDAHHVGGALDWTAESEEEVAASAARLVGLVAELGPDLLHLNSPALAAFRPFGVPVLAACHSCVATWWSAVKGDEALPHDLGWRAKLTARGYASADALLAPSRAFSTATQAAYSLAKAPHVVWNGRRSIEAPPVGLRPLKGRPAEVFTAGRLWDEGKDLASLERAAARLGDALTVSAAGSLDGPNGQHMRLSQVQALGRLDDLDLAAKLAQRPVFVSPSRYEPFGLAVLEAAQAGCALVLSDIATFRELWDGAASFFPPGDDAALAARITELVAEPDRRAALGAAAQARSARYTPQAMADATLKLYARLSPAFALTQAAA